MEGGRKEMRTERWFEEGETLSDLARISKERGRKGARVGNRQTERKECV